MKSAARLHVGRLLLGVAIIAAVWLGAKGLTAQAHATPPANRPTVTSTHR